jgi:endonuclease/exonuclease/phosphatase (EEP) superfamily protein YafD
MEKSKNMIFAVLSIVTGIFITLTLLPLLSYPAWWIRGGAFPRLQISTVLFILAGLQLWLLDWSRIATWVLILATVSALVYQIRWIIPYTRLFPIEVKAAHDPDPADMVRVMTANVLGTNRNAAGFLKLVRENDPDILVTLESDHWWEKQLEVLEKDYSHTIKCPLDNLYGMHVFSKLRLRNSDIKFLVEPDVPSMHTTTQLRNGHSVYFHFLHPKPPNPPTQLRRPEQESTVILRIARNLIRLRWAGGCGQHRVAAGMTNNTNKRAPRRQAKTIAIRKITCRFAPYCCWLS